MKNFNLLCNNLLKEVHSTNTLDYDQECMKYKGMIELCFAHGPFESHPAGYGIYNDEDGYVPEYEYQPKFVKRFTKDPALLPLITELFVDGYPINDLNLYKFASENLQDKYHKSRPALIRELAKDCYTLESSKQYAIFTEVDDYLCSTLTQFAKDCGDLFYREYVLNNVKNAVSRDEEDDISDW